MNTTEMQQKLQILKYLLIAPWVFVVGMGLYLAWGFQHPQYEDEGMGFVILFGYLIAKIIVCAIVSSIGVYLYRNARSANVLLSTVSDESTRVVVQEKFKNSLTAGLIVMTLYNLVTWLPLVYSWVHSWLFVV